MTILAQPQTVTSLEPIVGRPTMGATLVELQQIKADWLAAAIDNGYLETCRLIARTLGKPEIVKNWATWQAWRWQAGDIVIMLYEGSTHYLPWAKAFNQVQVIAVYVGGRQAVYYRKSEDPQESPDNFFVPGQWIDVVLSNREKAQETERGRSLTLVEKRRRQLLDQLLIGVDI